MRSFCEFFEELLTLIILDDLVRVDKEYPIGHGIHGIIVPEGDCGSAKSECCLRELPHSKGDSFRTPRIRLLSDGKQSSEVRFETREDHLGLDTRCTTVFLVE